MEDKAANQRVKCPPRQLLLQDMNEVKLFNFRLRLVREILEFDLLFVIILLSRLC